MANIVLGITKVKGTDEYKIVWNENGHPIEKNAYYTDSGLDAVLTLYNIAESTQRKGSKVYLATNRLTHNLVTSYLNLGKTRKEHYEP